MAGNKKPGKARFTFVQCSAYGWLLPIHRRSVDANSCAL